MGGDSEYYNHSSRFCVVAVILVGEAQPPSLRDGVVFSTELAKCPECQEYVGLPTRLSEKLHADCLNRPCLSPHLQDQCGLDGGGGNGFARRQPPILTVVVVDALKNLSGKPPETPTIDHASRQKRNEKGYGQGR